MVNNNTQICICGIGPGNPDYISPLVYKKVKEAEVLIGGKRQLNIFLENKKATVVFDGKLLHLKEGIINNENKKIVVLVSGDAGFHSLRRYIKQEFSNCEIEIVPGISSFQYLYAKVGLGYENAFFGSMHGGDINFIEKVKQYNSVFLLTDNKNNWKVIASRLVSSGMGDIKLHIGNKLSYSDEEIVSCYAYEAEMINKDFTLCCVIIENKWT